VVLEIEREKRTEITTKKLAEELTLAMKSIFIYVGGARNKPLCVYHR